MAEKLQPGQISFIGKMEMFIGDHPKLSEWSSNIAGLILGTGSRFSKFVRTEVGVCVYNDALQFGNRTPYIDKVYRFLTDQQRNEIETFIQKGLAEYKDPDIEFMKSLQRLSQRAMEIRKKRETL